MPTIVDVDSASAPVHPAPAAAVPGLLEDASRLSVVLGELIRLVQFRDRDRACCFDVSVSQCYALKGVADSGALTINDLAAYLYLDKSTASRIANALVDKGLLAREQDTEDGRVVRLVHTPDGAAVHSKIEADLATEYSELLIDFDPAIRAAVIELVGRLAESFASRVDASGGSCCIVR